MVGPTTGSESFFFSSQNGTSFSFIEYAEDPLFASEAALENHEPPEDPYFFDTCIAACTDDQMRIAEVADSLNRRERKYKRIQVLEQQCKHRQRILRGTLEERWTSVEERKAARATWASLVKRGIIRMR
jgi:hypothetical protein